MLVFAALLTGCAAVEGSGETVNATAAQTAAAKQPGIYDSEDVAIVVKKDTQAGTVQFQNVSTSRRYTLSYDGTTTLYDKNDQAISMGQLKEGSVVTVRFYKPDKTLTYVKENTDCISYRDVQNYTIDLKNGTILIGDQSYNISGHVVVVSDGRETDMMEVNQVDVISVWG